MKLLFLNLLLLVVCSNFTCEASDKKMFYSPDKSCEIEIIDAKQEDDNGNDKILILKKRGRIALKISTTGWLLDVIWSPNGQYVAINNRNANSGDYLWVFSVSGESVIRRPFDALDYDYSVIEAEYLELAGKDIYKEYVSAVGWSASNELQVNVAVFYKNIDFYISSNIAFAIHGHKWKLVNEKHSKKMRK